VIRHVGIRAVARIQTGINYSGIPSRFSMERDIDPVRRAAPADARSRAGDRPVQSPNEETMHISALTRKNRDDGRRGGEESPQPPSPSQLSADIARAVAAFFRRAAAACLKRKKKAKKKNPERERERERERVGKEGEKRKGGKKGNGEREKERKRENEYMGSGGGEGRRRRAPRAAAGCSSIFAEKSSRASSPTRVSLIPCP